MSRMNRQIYHSIDELPPGLTVSEIADAPDICPNAVSAYIRSRKPHSIHMGRASRHPRRS